MASRPISCGDGNAFCIIKADLRDADDEDEDGQGCNCNKGLWWRLHGESLGVCCGGLKAVTKKLLPLPAILLESIIVCCQGTLLA